MYIYIYYFILFFFFKILLTAASLLSAIKRDQEDVDFSTLGEFSLDANRATEVADHCDRRIRLCLLNKDIYGLENRSPILETF